MHYFSYEDRRRIEFFLEEGKTFKEMGEIFKVNAKTIQKEVLRGSVEGVYSAKVATAVFEKEEKERFFKRIKMNEDVFYVVVGKIASGFKMSTICSDLKKMGYDISYSTLANWKRSGLFDVRHYDDLLK